MTSKLQVIILKETPRESLQRDAGMVAAYMAMILPGWWIGSDALQWIGAVLAMIWMVVKALNILGAQPRLTIQEARAALDKLEGRQ